MMRGSDYLIATTIRLSQSNYRWLKENTRSMSIWMDERIDEAKRNCISNARIVVCDSCGAQHSSLAKVCPQCRKGVV